MQTVPGPDQTVMAASRPTGAVRLSSSNHRPPSPRYRKCSVLPTGTVTAALRVWFARRRSGWARGFQSLKLPTTDTAPSGSSAGRANVTRTVPSRSGLVVLINCSLQSGAQLRYTRSIIRESRQQLRDLTQWQPDVSPWSGRASHSRAGRGDDSGRPGPRISRRHHDGYMEAARPGCALRAAPDPAGA